MYSFLTLAFWVHNIDPFFIKFPETFSFPGIRWYGVAYLLGFVAAGVLLHVCYKQKRSPLDTDAQMTLLTTLMIGVLVGGRLGYVLLYDTIHFMQDPLIFFKVWHGGMASHGGFVGVIVAILWFAHHAKKSSFLIGDIVATLAPLGFFFGRIANFINGGLWGKITYVPWAVIFPQSAPGMPPQMIEPRHPSQLYAALLEGLLLFIYTQYRFWKRSPQTPSGQLGGEFLIAYAILRIIGEIFREPDASLILGISRGQFYSIFIALGGILVIVLARKKAAKQA